MWTSGFHNCFRRIRRHVDKKVGWLKSVSEFLHDVPLYAASVLLNEEAVNIRAVLLHLHKCLLIKRLRSSYRYGGWTCVQPAYTNFIAGPAAALKTAGTNPYVVARQSRRSWHEDRHSHLVRISNLLY